jgi:hypothetical protein
VQQDNSIQFVAILIVLPRANDDNGRYEKMQTRAGRAMRTYSLAGRNVTVILGERVLLAVAAAYGMEYVTVQYCSRLQTIAFAS